MNPDHANLDAILARVDMLERRIRRIKRTGAGLAIAALGLFLIGWATAYDLQTFEGRFYLRDKDGNFKGAFLADPASGMGNLMIGTAVEAQNETGGRTLQPQPHFNLGYRMDNGEPYMTIFDKAGRVRVGLGIGSDGETYLELYEKSGALLWTAKK